MSFNYTRNSPDYNMKYPVKYHLKGYYPKTSVKSMQPE